MKAIGIAVVCGAALIVGCDGDSGSAGVDGFDSLVAQTALPVLDQSCAFGGVRIDSGLDFNRDNLLSASEVSATSTVCDSAESSALDDALRQVALDRDLGGDPTAGRMLQDIDDPLSQLGMLLFFSKGLGGDMDSACVSCHHPFLGGGDKLALPVGVAAEVQDLLGPGRTHRSDAEDFDGGPTVPRNAPTTFNIALWDQVLFHDGRVESLTKTPGTNGSDGETRTPDVAFGAVDPEVEGSMVQAQARFPVTSPEEMRGFTFQAGEGNDAVRRHLEARFRGSPAELPHNDWLAAFRAGFEESSATAEELITFNNITRAIAAYESSQVFVDNAFARYLDGDDGALSAPAKLGALLFYGEAGCDSCHSGNFMTDEGFHVIAMPQIGRGKGDGIFKDNDFGRFRETGEEVDRFAFRTPSLLNVAVTGPYGHAGAYESLAAVVEHHLDPRSALEKYRISRLPAGVQASNMYDNTLAAIEQLEALQARGTSRLPAEITLSSERVGWIVAFLESLTDVCVTDRTCLSRWVPDISHPDPDGLRVRAVDRLGNPL